MSSNAAEQAVKLQNALGQIEKYFSERRLKVDPFVEKHFSLKGTLVIHKRTFGFDLVRHVLNAYFAVPCIAVKKTVSWFETLGMDRIAHLFNLIPSGLRTDYQKEVERLVARELLKISDDKSSGSDELQSLFGTQALGSLIQPDLLAHSSGRAGITEMAGSAVTLIAAYRWFHNTSLGPLEMGKRLASMNAHKKAVSKFFLGRKLGSVFYKTFPVAPSKHEVMLATAFVVFTLSALTLLTVILSDPVQHRMGVHRRKLLKLLDSLEAKMVLLAHRQFGQAKSGGS